MHLHVFISDMIYLSHQRSIYNVLHVYGSIPHVWGLRDLIPRLSYWSRVVGLRKGLSTNALDDMVHAVNACSVHL
jgi:hypothetical protein